MLIFIEESWTLWVLQTSYLAQRHSSSYTRGRTFTQSYFPVFLDIWLTRQIRWTQLPVIKTNVIFFHKESSSQTSFCQAGPGRLAVLLEAVQEGWNCLVSCPHRSYSSDSFIHLEEWSSTSVWALTVCHILVEGKHFVKKKKGNKFGKKIFRFHPTVNLLYLKECQFYTKF